MSGTANYAVIQATETRLVLKDIGPWDRYMTVTNAAEAVIAEIDRDYGIGDRRVFYFDSDNELTELVVRGGRFAGFKAVPNGDS